MGLCLSLVELRLKLELFCRDCVTSRFSLWWFVHCHKNCGYRNVIHWCIVKRQTPTLNGKAEKNNLLKTQVLLYASECTIWLRQTRMKVYGILQPCMLDSQQIYILCNLLKARKMFWYTGNVFVVCNYSKPHVKNLNVLIHKSLCKSLHCWASCDSVHRCANMKYCSIDVDLYFLQCIGVYAMRVVYAKMHSFCKCVCLIMNGEVWFISIHYTYFYESTFNMSILSMKIGTKANTNKMSRGANKWNSGC